MSVNTTLSGLSQTASSNGPDGTVDPPSTLDDSIRYALAFIATLRDGKGFTNPGTLASAGTTDIGAQNALAVEISGTTTITSFGTTYNGPRFLRFTGALILTHNATTLNLPGAANITTAAGYTAVAYPNQAANGWNVVAYQQAAITPGNAVTQAAADNTTKIATTAYADRAASGASAPPVRQTVLSGPVDSNGFAAFGGSVGGATLTTSGTIKATAAAGGDANYTGSIVNPAFTSPGGSGTGYLMLAITSAGVVTASVRTLQPAYQWGGTYSITSGQFTFNIQEMTAKVGNGASAAQVYEVCIGECPYTAGVWSGTIVWYQLMRRFTGAWVATLPTSSATVSTNHNIGMLEYIAQFEAECTTNDSGYVVGDRVDLLVAGVSGTSNISMAIRKQRNLASIGTGNGSGTPFVVSPAGGGASVGLTNANWKYRFVCQPKF